MIIKRYENNEQMSVKAAKIVKEQIVEKPNSVLGLPTGSSPLGMYDQLIAMYKRGEIDFSSVKTFNLDEYCGLPTDHPQSYHKFMDKNFFRHVNIKPENIHMPKPDKDGQQSVCEEYEQLIRQAGGIDLQILGIGRNGHIGFNEPGTSFSSRTHVIQLHEETRQANARFFNTIEEVPKAAVTMGIKTIMRAQKILLLISGEAKQEALYKLVQSSVSEAFPASALQLHPDVTVLTEKSSTQMINESFEWTNNELVV
ncbi:MAG: glucosamine-6-phosphate deaminase [Thermotogota bacterium]